MTVELGPKLSPRTGYDQEILSRYGFGHTVEVTIWQNRSLPHHRFFFGMLHYCVANTENKYGSTDDLLSALKVAQGYTHRIKLLRPSAHATIALAIKQYLTAAKRGLVALLVEHLLRVVVAKDLVDAIIRKLDDSMKLATQFETECEYITLPGSIAFDNMDEAEFKVFAERSQEQLRSAGYPVDAYLREMKKQLGPVIDAEPGSYHELDEHVSQPNQATKPTLPPPDHH